MFLSALRKLLRPTPGTALRPGSRPRLRVDDLEDRWCPAVISVDDDLVQKPTANFTTITAALNAANANDQIEVYKGTYAEQLTVSKNGIKLVAKPSNGFDVMIVAPADVAATPA